jgi:hypothetical protein
MNGLRTTPDMLVHIVLNLTNPDPPYEPTQDEIDTWLIAGCEVDE